MPGVLAYVQRHSPLHELNPVTVLTYTLCVTVLGLAANQLWLLAGLLALSLALIALAGVFARFLSIFLRVTLPITIPMFLVHSFFFPGARTILYRLGPLSLRLEGVLFASNIISRLLTILAAYFLMILVVHPRDLMIALGERGVSPKIGYLVLSTLQLIPYIQQTAERILDAQRSRGLSLKGSLLKRLRSYLPLLGPVVMGSFSTLEIRAMAMEVRGFNLPTRRSYIREIPDRPGDRVLRLATLAGSAALLGLSIYLRMTG